MPGWPQNKLARELDAHPDWDVAIAKTLTYAHVTNLPKDTLRIIKKQTLFWNAISKETRDFIDDCVIHRPEDPPINTALSLVHVTSMAERAMEVESLRQRIPAHQIIEMLLTAVATGVMPGSEEVLEAKERAKIGLALLAKSLPEAKSIEVDERSGRADRKRRKLADHTAAELKALSEDELRDLINQTKEES